MIYCTDLESIEVKLSQMDTSCHVHSTCNLVWDSVLTHQAIMQPEGSQVFIP